MRVTKKYLKMVSENYKNLLAQKVAKETRERTNKAIKEIENSCMKGKHDFEIISAYTPETGLIKFKRCRYCPCERKQ